eukprot:472409-Amorphochlora_amoeboformis.AAC.1
MGTGGRKKPGEEEPKKASSSALDSLNSFFGDDADGGESQTKTEPKKGTVEALFKAAEETSQAQVVWKIVFLRFDRKK